MVQVESCFKIGESLAVVLVKSRSQICQNLVMQVKKIWICQNVEVIASFKSFNYLLQMEGPSNKSF